MLIAIVQARMTSRRLPGKVLSDVLGEPMLLRQLERVARARLDGLVVATSTDESDDPIESAVGAAGYRCYRGSLDDVLDRVHGAARSEQATDVIRLTADCPLVDAGVVDEIVGVHRRERNDYTSNTLERTYPDGVDVEVIAIRALDRAWKHATGPEEREHVTPYIYHNPALFRLGNASAAEDHSQMRWTVDYPEDLQLVREVFAALYPSDPEFSYRDVLELFRRRPELESINAAVNPFSPHYEKRDRVLP